jgi:hypothetical protein
MKTLKAKRIIEKLVENIKYFSGNYNRKVDNSIRERKLVDRIKLDL